jgi:hypothetical protein
MLGPVNANDPESKPFIQMNYITYETRHCGIRIRSVLRGSDKVRNG